MKDHNYSFTMLLSREFRYEKGMKFRFEGDDDVWVFINNKIVMDLGGIHMAVADSFNLDDKAAQLGLELGKKYVMRFFYCERQATESHIWITSNIISAKLDSIKLQVHPSPTIHAGDTAKILATLYSDTGKINNFPGKITWGYVDTKGLNDSLSTFHPFKDSSLVTPTKAPTDLKVWATVYDSVSGKIISDTVIIHVIPGHPAMLIIEPENDSLKYPYAPHPFPNNTITILANQTEQNGFAILRDKFGNFSRTSIHTTWDPGDPSIDSITKGNTNKGEGIVHRKKAGETDIHATDNDTNITGTAHLVIKDYYYTAIKIYVKNPLDTTISALTMNTNQDTTLYTRGKRSDNGQWEDLSSCDWSTTGNLKTDNPPPQSMPSWHFSPTDTGRGYIYAKLDSLKDSLNTLFLPGPARKIELVYITPELERIAGRPIKTEISIRNDDNMLIPGEYHGKSAFTDLLPNIKKMVNLKGDTMIPSVIIDGKTVPLGNLRMLQFQDGKAYVYFLLYYVPPAGQFHEMKVSFWDSVDNQIIPLTDQKKTVLYPGPVAIIDIRQPNNDPFPSDTVIITVGFSKLFKTIGWDEYHNFIGDIVSIWDVDKPLPYKTGEGVQFNYPPEYPDSTTKGYLHADAKANTAVTDSIYIILKANQIQLANAKTLDLSGNGYLDGIEVNFSKPVAISKKSILDNCYAKYDTVTFKVIDIKPPLGTASQKHTLILQEHNNYLPQTAWLPYLTFQEKISDDVEEITSRKCEDGAAPVIWKVVKTVYDVNDLKKDVVSVTLSENFYSGDGALFLNKGPIPEKVFNVYTLSVDKKDTNLLDGMFASINKFDKQEYDWTTFTMSNGKDLNENHWMNLQWRSGLVADKPLNTPNENNRKVRVMVVGNIGKITIAPIPLIPTVINPIKTNTLDPNDPKKIYDLVNTNGGCMITVKIKIDVSNNGKPQGTLTGVLLVFDAASNLVYKISNMGNILDSKYLIGDTVSSSNNTSSSTKTLCFYWYGTSNDGRKSSVGVYRLIMHLTYRGPFTSSKTNAAETIAVGMRKLE
jgi:fibro-slime domain-containing protein